MVAEKMKGLRALLDRIGPGKIPQEYQAEVIERLQEVWDEIPGPDLQSYKLARAEDLEWAPPFLRFCIERHGGTVHGSSRAEMQQWFVDIEKVRCDYEPAGYRQLYPLQPRWKAEGPAREVAQLILQSQRDPRVRWLSESKVQVLTAQIIPRGPRQTTEGRRQRFYKALDAELKPLGWTRRGSYYLKESSA